MIDETEPLKMNTII